MASFIKKSLQALEAKNHLRSLKVVEERRGCEIVVEGQTLVDFSSNDYLGLSQHPQLKERAKEYAEKYGTSSAASRLVSGHLSCFEKIEKKIAAFKKTESALLVGSGFQANITLIPALAKRSSLILVDRLAHNSIMQGILLSGAKWVRFAHNDMDHLEKLLKKLSSSYSQIFVITESIFSMEGDGCDLSQLTSIAKKYGAFTFVDEAHATGVFGKEGAGFCRGLDVDLVMGTFSKAMGSFGAYVASSSPLKQYLLNFCHGVIYSTALPPPILGAIDAALDLVPTMDGERKHLLSLSQKLARALMGQGWTLTKTISPIIPMIVGEASKALLLYQKLLEAKIFAIPIRPPTVPEGKARMRFSLSALHQEKEIDHLIQTLGFLAKEER